MTQQKYLFGRDLLGCRVRYQKENSASRNGWHGTIIGVTSDRLYPRVTIQWDELPDGEGTEYRADALDCVLPSGGIRNTPYIFFTGEQGGGLPFLIIGKNGGPTHRVYGDLNDAQDFAEKAAAQSKSGQPYALYIPYEEFERQDPPVSRRKV